MKKMLITLVPLFLMLSSVYGDWTITLDRKGTWSGELTIISASSNDTVTNVNFGGLKGLIEPLQYFPVTVSNSPERTCGYFCISPYYEGTNQAGTAIYSMKKKFAIRRINCSTTKPAYIKAKIFLAIPSPKVK